MICAASEIGIGILAVLVAALVAARARLTEVSPVGLRLFLHG